MVAAAALFFSALRPQIETLQPLDASACAMPSPIPPLPPVITAVGPERSKMLTRVSSKLFSFGWAGLLFQHDLVGKPGSTFRTMLLDVHPAQGDVLVQPWTSAPQKSNMGGKTRRAENALIS